MDYISKVTLLAIGYLAASFGISYLILTILSGSKILLSFVFGLFFAVMLVRNHQNSGFRYR